MRFVVRAALWGQLWELREEPVTVFEETILVDCVKLVPVFIGPAVVVLCKGRAHDAMLANHHKQFKEPNKTMNKIKLKWKVSG